MIRASFRFILTCLLLLAAQLSASADAISVTKAMQASTVAEIFVDEQGLRIELEIGFADIKAFANLLPDSSREKLGLKPAPLAERVERFFQEDFVIRPDQGQPLVGRIEQLEARDRLQRDEITGDPMPVQPAKQERILFVELSYTWDQPPNSLSLQPPLNEDAPTPAASIGFVLYHDSVAVNDFRYLASTFTVDLDWSDPWYSRFRTRNLIRQFDAPLSVFLYVDAFEVRKEIVIRPKDLQQWVDLGLQGQRQLRSSSRMN